MRQVVRAPEAAQIAKAYAEGFTTEDISTSLGIAPERCEAFRPDDAEPTAAEDDAEVDGDQETVRRRRRPVAEE